MYKCCFDFVKFVVFIINFAAFIGAALLLSLGIYVLVKAEDVLGFQVTTELSADNPTAVWFSFILIFIVIFGFLTLFLFLGCCGAACQNRCMLGSFIIILFVFLGGYVGAIVYIFIKFPNEVEMVASELEKTIPYYKADDTESLVRKFWDFVQPSLECCGVSSWHDWKLAASGLKQGRQIPASCCQKVIVDPSSDCMYHPDSDNAYLIGCLTKVQLPLRITFWAIPSVMALILVATLCLCSNCNNSRDLQDTEPISPRRKHSHQRGGTRGSETEETGYVYRRTPTPNYPSAPPYNPDYPPLEVSDPYGGRYGYGGSTDSYPTGVIPPHCQPLIQPPAYHDVVGR